MKNFIGRHIGKKWLIIMLLAALVEPAQYFLLIHYPTPGKTFMSYDTDEALVSGLMRSPELGFDNPWSPGEKVFFNGAIGSPYPYIILGGVRMLLGIDALLMNILAKFVLFFAFLVVLFKTMEAIMPRRHELGLVFFIAPLGLMPIGYLLGSITGVERFVEGFSFEFILLNNISRVYYYVPLITGFLSLLFFSKGQKTKAAITLGLTFFFYPFFGFAFAGLALLYSISGKHGTIQEKARQTISETWKMLAIGMLFSVHWIYARLSHPEYFTLYNENSLIWRAHVVGLAGSYFFLMAIILLANMDTAKKYWKFLAVAGILSLIVMIAELNMLRVPPFTSIILPGAATELLEIFLLAIFAVAWLVLDSEMDRRVKFIILFALVFFPLSMLNPKYAFWQQYRMGYVLHIPMAMLAALYFDRFVEKMRAFGIGKVAVFAAIAILASSSFLAYNYRFQMVDRWVGIAYFDTADKDAMKFLDSQPTGVVLASDTSDYYIPTWSGQYVLYHPAESQYLGGGPNREEKKVDTAAFYSGTLGEAQAKSIIDRYGISYVFYGSEEAKLGILPGYTFMEKIYDNDARVYKILA